MGLRLVAVFSHGNAEALFEQDLGGRWAFPAAGRGDCRYRFARLPEAPLYFVETNAEHGLVEAFVLKLPEPQLQKRGRHLEPLGHIQHSDPLYRVASDVGEHLLDELPRLRLRHGGFPVVDRAYAHFSVPALRRDRVPGHHPFEELRREASLADEVRLDARELGARVLAEDWIVVHTENPHFGGNLQSEIVADVEDLEAFVVA